MTLRIQVPSYIISHAIGHFMNENVSVIGLLNEIFVECGKTLPAVIDLERLSSAKRPTHTLRALMEGAQRLDAPGSAASSSHFLEKRASRLASVAAKASRSG